MHNYRVEKEKPPVDGSTQYHDIDKKGYNYIFKEYGMALNEPACPEGVKEPA